MSLQNVIDTARFLGENLVKGNIEAAASNLQGLADSFSQILGLEIITNEELKSFNGIMKYIMVSFENGDYHFGSQVVKNSLIPLLISLQIKQTNTDDVISDDIDDITKAIKTQYTGFMYPNKWKGIIPENVRKGNSVSSVEYNLDFIQHMTCRKKLSSEKLNVLVAGCGTGEAALICALNFPKANHTWIDISPASLAMAKKYSEEMKLNNVEIFQADIMTMDLNNQFDVIISTGVIHHLSDPSKGVANLKKHLKDDGVLSAMVYGEYGRFEIGLFQEALKIMLKNNVDFNKGIEIVKTLVKELDQTNRIANIAWMQDLKKGEQHIVDLLLNVNENRYNIRSLNKMVNDGGMKIICFPNKGGLNPDNYIKSNELRDQNKDLGFMDRCYLAELINGRMYKHHFFAVKQENEYNRLLIDDVDSDNYYIYKSPVMIETTIVEAGRKRHSIKLNAARLYDSQNFIEYADVIIEGNYVGLLDMCDGSKSVRQVINALKGKLSADQIKNFIRVCGERDILFLHEK